MKSTNPLRQKMINVMYLILIAMTLLNPLLDYIDIFKDINRSLERTNQRLERESNDAIRQLSIFSQLDEVNYGEMYQRVKQAKEIADSTVEYIEEIKQGLIEEADGYNEWGHLYKAIDASISARVMITEGTASELRDSLIKTKDALLMLLGEEDQEMLDSVLVVDEDLYKRSGLKFPWEEYYFERSPLNAVITVLTKFQNDVRWAEKIVIGEYDEQVMGEGGLGNWSLQFVSEPGDTFDTIQLATGVQKRDVFMLDEKGMTSIVLPKSVKQGAEQAWVQLYDDFGNIIDTFEFDPTGRAEVTLDTENIGQFKIKGVVKVKYKPTETTGDEQPQDEGSQFLEQEPVVESFEFEKSYEVTSRPYVSQKDYNLLYIGINNPINAFHGEYEFPDYKVDITQGKIIKTRDQLYARVYRRGYAMVSLSIPDNDTETGYRKVAQEKFRVVPLPTPKVRLYNKFGGEMSAKLFKQQKGLNTDLKDLAIDADFDVVEYTVTYVNAAGLGIFKEKVRGEYFSGKAKELIDLAQPGDIFIFDDIVVKGPNGINKDIDPLVFNIL